MGRGPGEVGVPGQASQEPSEGFGQTESGRVAVGRLTQVAVPGVSATGHQVAQRDEDGDDDRGRPASGPGFQDDRDATDHEPRPPCEGSQRHPGEAASDAGDHATEKLPRQRPQGHEQVEARLAVAEASDPMGEEGGDLGIAEVAGAEGVHDLTVEDHVSASRAADRLTQGGHQDAEVRPAAAGGDQMEGCVEASGLEGGRTAGGVQDPHGQTFDGPGRHPHRDPEQSRQEADRHLGGEEGHAHQPQQAADDQVGDDDGRLEESSPPDGGAGGAWRGVHGRFTRSRGVAVNRRPQGRRGSPVR